MNPWLLAPLTLAGAWYLWRGYRARSRGLALADVWLQATVPGSDAVRLPRLPGGPQFPRRYRWAPWAAALLTAAVMTMLGLATPLPFSFAALAGVGVWLLESYWAERQVDRMESQLADAIDLMVGSLRAGAALLASLDAALREAGEPFAGELNETIGRMRLGEDPAEAIGAMARRVPLETFRFFAVSVAVHWETGGSLATTLTSVARTIRERVEMARRVRAQSVEANISVLAVMLISYGVALMMWRSNPETVSGFMTSTAGAWILAGCVFLQAVGAFWITTMSRVEH